jgi:hypothetical protein
MRRNLSIGIIAVVLATTTPAFAGGTWMRVDPRESTGAGTEGPGAWGGWASVGAGVVMRAELCADDVEAAPTTWSVFLEPYGRVGDRIAVGSATVDGVGEGGCTIRLTARFRVPDVEAGAYVAVVCDAACRRFPGDLLGGFLRVAPTPALALLRTRIAQLRRQVSAATAASERRTARIADLRVQLADARALRTELAAVQASLDHVTGQRDVALDQRERGLAATTRAREDADGWRLTAYILAAALLFTLAVVQVRRRHSVRIRIPDTADELLAEADDRADAG